MATILGIDPGETTGICIYTTHSRLWEFDQLGPHDHHNDLWRLMNSCQPDWVVCESFTKRPNNPAAILISMEYIGVVKLWCEMIGRPLHLQSVSDAKNVWPNRKLQKLGIKNLPPATPAHRRDAMRHVLLFLQKNLAEYYWLQKATKPGS